MKPIDAQAVEALVDAELGRVGDVTVRTLIQSARVPVRCELRPWDYGEPGQTFPCWIVLEAGEVAVAYCDQGFGPKSPWGLLWVRGAQLNMGDARADSARSV
jgi:hypothetical protein